MDRHRFSIVFLQWVHRVFTVFCSLLFMVDRFCYRFPLAAKPEHMFLVCCSSCLDALAAFVLAQAELIRVFASSH